MRKPEYWESQEIQEQYAEWIKDQPEPQPETLSPLAAAVAKARGDIRTEDDMRAAINFGNKLIAALRRPDDKNSV